MIWFTFLKVHNEWWVENGIGKNKCIDINYEVTAGFLSSDGVGLSDWY